MSDFTAWVIVIESIIILILAIYANREFIFKIYYHNRRVTAIFLDTREYINLTLPENKNTFEAYGTKIWSRNKSKNGTNFYLTTMAEPLEAELDAQKCKYWCDSYEYHTNMKNDLLETLMMLKGKDTIIMILFIILVVVIISLGYYYISNQSVTSQLKEIITTLNQTGKIS